MTKPATASEYITIPVATVVGGTLKLFTMPLSATGREATLKDMIAWPRAIAIIGSQDSLVADPPPALVAVFVVMASFLRFWARFLIQRSCILNRWERHLAAMIVAGSRSHKGRADQTAGFEAKRLSPSRSDRYLVTRCPLMLLPAPSSSGEKVPKPPFPGDTVTMPPLTPLFPGSPIS